jgi:hypothetical protein
VTKELAVASRQHVVWHFLFHQAVNFVRRLYKKQKSRHFYTIEVIEADSQAMLKTLTGNNFQDAFKNGRSADNDAFERKGPTTSVTVASRLKVLEIMDGFLYTTFGYKFLRPT